MIHEPALIVTWLCHASENQSIQACVRHLARPAAAGGFALVQRHESEWVSSDERILLIRFQHHELPDIIFLQLSVNARISGGEGWVNALQQVEKALEGLTPAMEQAFLGRTLVYQAWTADTLEDAAQKVLNSGVLRMSTGPKLSRALAVAREAPGGALWLLASPGEANEEAVYLALGPKQGQETLIFGVLVGREAALLWPDAIMHKVRNVAAPYTRDGRARYLQAMERLQQRTVALLQARTSPSPGTLFDLNGDIARLSVIQAELRRLHSVLAIQQWNHDRAVFSLPWFEPIAAYQRLRIESILQRVAHDCEESKGVLDAAQRAVNSLRAEYEARRAKAAERTNWILALVGLLLALLQVIDADAETMWRRLIVLVFILAAIAGALAVTKLHRRR